MQIATVVGGRLLATYEGIVYDVTQFADAHPGGRELLLTATGCQNLESVHVHTSSFCARWRALWVAREREPLSTALSRHTESLFSRVVCVAPFVLIKKRRQKDGDVQSPRTQVRPGPLLPQLHRARRVEQGGRVARATRCGQALCRGLCDNRRALYAGGARKNAPRRLKRHKLETHTPALLLPSTI